MNTTLVRYGAALLPLGIAVLGVLDAANRAGTALLGWQTILQIIVLLATTGAALWLPLVSGPWAGALKTGAGIVGAIASALIATIPTGGEFTTATLILVLTAVFKAVATEIGVQIRLDAAKTGSTPDTAQHGMTRQEQRALLGLTVNGRDLDDQESEITDPGAEEPEATR